MKQFIILVTVFIPLFVTAQDISGKGWKIEKSVLAIGNDSAQLYNKDSSNNRFNLSEIAYWFIESNKYSGFAIDGALFNGDWKQIPGKLVIDGDTSLIEYLGTSKLILSHPCVLSDTLNNLVNGISTLYMYSIPVVQSETVKDGDWNDSTVWTTGKIPTSTSKIIVKHLLTVTQPAICYHLFVEGNGKIAVMDGIKLNITNTY